MMEGGVNMLCITCMPELCQDHMADCMLQIYLSPRQSCDKYTATFAFQAHVKMQVHARLRLEGAPQTRPRKGD